MSRILTIEAHSIDSNVFTFPNGKEFQGYVPNNIGIGGDDDIYLRIDIDSGKIIGWSDEIRDRILSLQESKLNRNGDPV